MIDFVINPFPLPIYTMEIVFPMPVAGVFIHVIQHVALLGKGDPHRTSEGFMTTMALQ